MNIIQRWRFRQQERKRLKADLRASRPPYGPLPHEVKQKIVDAALDSSSKTLLAAFVIAGLKTHISAEITNQYNGDRFELSFKKIDPPEGNLPA